MGRKISFLLSYWWCMLLLVLGLIPFVLGNREGGVSETENRNLQAAPTFTLETWFDGSFSSQLEAYLSDQMLGRDAILSVSRSVLDAFNITSESEQIVNATIDEQLDEIANAGVDAEEDWGLELPAQQQPTADDEASPAQDNASAGNTASDAPAAEQDAADPADPVDPSVKDLSITRRFALIRADGTTTARFHFDESAMKRTINSLNTYRTAVPEDGSVVFTYVPYSYDANEWLLDTEDFSGWSSDVEPTLQANVDEGVYIFSTVEELAPHMAAGEPVFYNVDHHWSGLGAFYMQRAMMQRFGVPPTAYEDYEYTIHEGFRGSLAKDISRDISDRLEVPDPLAPTHSYVYRHLDELVRETEYMEPDRVSYSAFLGGTHSPFYVVETGFHTGHGALVICDSFGNAFVPYLVPYYDRVCLVDLRDTYSFVTGGGGAPLRDYIKEYGIDDVYFIVSRGTGINSSYMQQTVLKYL